MTTEHELALRRAKVAQIKAHQAANPQRVAQQAAKIEERIAHRPACLQILDRFFATGDVEDLRLGLQSWSQSPAFHAFGGVNGQMFLNQLVKASPESNQLSRLLVQSLAVPQSVEAAAQAIDALGQYAESVKKGPHPAPKRSIFFLSFFWWLQSPADWPCYWTSAERTLIELGWLTPTDAFGATYTAYRTAVLELGAPEEVEWILSWLADEKFTGLGSWTVERCVQNAAFSESMSGDNYASLGDQLQAATNARSVIGELRQLGEALSTSVSDAFSRELKVEVPSLYWGKKYRGDGWVRWGLLDEGAPSASYRVWVTRDGLFIGLHPGWYRNGWYPEAIAVLRESAPASALVFPVRLDSTRVDPRPDAGFDGEALLGWHYPQRIDDAEELRNEIVKRAAELQPAMDRIVALAGGRINPETQAKDDPLRARVEQFLLERQYPNAQDEAHRAERAVMAATIAEDQIRVMDLADLRRIWSTSKYGSPGPQSILNTTFRDATPTEIEDYLERIHYLVWGPGDDADRIDAMLDPEDRWIKGLGTSSIMKLLAVAHPERYVPVYPYGGENGKARLIKALGVEPPPEGLTVGRRQVAANNIIR